MNWIDDALEQLNRQPVCGYAPEGEPASEPTALASLALRAYGKRAKADRAASWLTEMQGKDGSVGVTATQITPRWPTSLAVLAWLDDDEKFGAQPNVSRAIEFILSIHGTILKDTNYLGHDTSIVGWPWVEGTHSWIEPTALNVMALKAAGLAAHPRTREAVRLLLDRQLSSGGCNCGNTVVLGQELRAHLLPSGMALVALAGEEDRRIVKSLSYIVDAIDTETTSASLAWALLGLAAHGRSVPNADHLLAAAFQRMRKRDNSPHKAALLLLAALGSRSPLITLPAGKARA